MAYVSRADEAGERLVRISMREDDISVNGQVACQHSRNLFYSTRTSPWAIAFVVAKLLVDGLSTRL